MTQPRRVLVVEDNPLNLKLVRDVLLAVGYDVVTATTGEEGIEAARRQAPDIVLMDLQLPGIDGTESLRRLRDGVIPRSVPVVAVTALAMPSDRTNAYAAGFDRYVVKPISVRDLPVLIESLVSKADSR